MTSSMSIRMRIFFVVLVGQSVLFLLVAHRYHLSRQQQQQHSSASHGPSANTPLDAEQDVIARRIVRSKNLFASNAWILNHNISHYSSMLDFNSTGDGSIELTQLAFIKRQLERHTYLKSNLKCLVKINSKIIMRTPHHIFEIHYKNMPFGARSIWRVKCRLNRSDYTNTNTSTSMSVAQLTRQVHVALVDRSWFEHWTRKLRLDIADVVLFHRPSVLQRHVPKRAQVAHCLHKVIDLTPQRFHMLVNWLEMQRRIGVARVRMCLFDYAPQYVSTLRAKFPRAYLDIVFHQTKMHDVCRWQLNMFNRYPNSR